MPSDRPQFRARLDEDTYDSLKDFLRAHGLDAGPFMEALAQMVVGAARGDIMPTWLRRLIAEARVVQVDRRDRRPQD